MSLLAHVRTGLARLHAPAAPTVVAVSGGADSIALLHALVRFREPGDPSVLIVAHLNHGLRGIESDGDEEFVRNLHGELTRTATQNLEFRCDRIDMAAQTAAVGGNLEAVARRMRYDWLASVATEFGIPRVATAHSADDQAETVLHRLLRGSGLQGLRGIAPRRELCPGVELIRPMLSATRADVLAFLQEIGQPFREDRSNADVRFTRNRLRHDLLPQLARDYNPDIRSNLALLAEQAADAFADIEARARLLLAECELAPAGEMRILDRMKLAAAPRHAIREALRVLWQREGWPCERMRFEDWDRAAAVVCGEVTAVDFPGGVHVRNRGRMVQLERRTNFSEPGA
jgi:tRNA(Ile)-lysidine synthase